MFVKTFVSIHKVLVSKLAPVFLFGTFSLFVELMARFGFRSNLFSTCKATSGKPFVPDDVYETEALVRLLLEHPGDQVLELLRVKTLRLAIITAVSHPEEVRSLSRE